MENSGQRSYSIRKLKDRLFIYAAVFCAGAAVLPLILLLGYVIFKGASSLTLSFFTHVPVPVGENGGGIGNGIIGTLMIVGLGCVFSLPIGIFSGIWLSEWGKGKTGFIVRYCVDVMSGVPTIVLALFSYTVFVLTMHRFSAIAGGFAVAMIMLPYITKTTEEMLKMVPRTLRESALALGIPEWRVSLSVVVRSAWSGIFTGVMLAVARAAGETAPLLFTAFNSMYWNFMPDQPTASMTVQIYTYAISPYEQWHNMAWAGSLVLIGIVLFVTIFVRKFSKRVNFG
ncbi:MAG: phosphate ABC transporter permease PstA [Candidatus Saganbacteria bacterium]|nr:phosphate ABC transporter permease PstA [Candidatus Saganbacteria bacterium]